MEILLQIIIANLLLMGRSCFCEKLDISDSLTLKILERMDVLEKKNEKLEKQSEILETKVKMLEQKNKRLKKRQAQISEIPVAFTVALSQGDKPIGDHQTIEYDHVITNLGNGYEPRTGHFTCPVKGLYLFAVTTMSPYDGHRDLYTEVVKDGVEVTRMYATLSGASSTTAVFLITLNIGDMVWVRSNVRFNQIIHGDNYNIFSGSLISQMP